MGFHTGTYIAIAAALLFYLRLIILQRQKAKQRQSKPGKRGGKTSAPVGVFRPTLEFSNKFLVILGAALILLGALVSFLPSLNQSIRDGWWLPVTAGIFLMSLGIR